MTWSEDEVLDAKRALVGSWPGTIVQWGAEAIDAYLYVLQARGLTAAQVLRAIGTWPAGSDFPPSAPNLAAQALKDPSKPTFEEAYRLIYGRGGALKARAPRGQTYANEAAMLGAHDDAAQARAWDFHSLVGSFVERYGVRRLVALEVDHPEYGELKRRELREAWDRHCEAMDGRDVAALAAGRRRGELAEFDPLAAITAGAHQVKRAELERR